MAGGTSQAELRERWRTYLRDQSLNTTKQRDAIVEQFLRTTGHISVDELLARVRKNNRRVGHATVYRTLKLLVDSGVAVSRHFKDGQTRFELDSEHHDHLICTSCGKIVEFEEDEIEHLQTRVAESLGFKLTSHRHELYGLCSDCQGNN